MKKKHIVEPEHFFPENILHDNWNDKQLANFAFQGAHLPVYFH